MPKNSPKVVVIGGTYIDMAMRCEQVPLPGQNVRGSGFSYSVAGPGPNQAAEAALCGCTVYLISKLGGDALAQLVKDELEEFGVHTDFIFTAEAKNTGVIVTLVDAAGENAVCRYAGANCALGEADIEAAEQVISEADVCLIHGELPQEAIIKAIGLSNLHNTKVILNPARPLNHADKQGGELPAEYFNANIMIPNLYEAADIIERSEANIHAAKLIGSELITRGVNEVVITMGKRGCVVADRKGADHIPAFSIEIVDKTGTGDAFAGALAASYAVEEDLRKAVKFACAAGALACTKFGTMDALPTRAEIIELLQKEDVE